MKRNVKNLDGETFKSVGLNVVIFPAPFLRWAEEYFAASGSNLNTPIARKAMYSSYLDFAGNSPENKITRFNFKVRIINFCLSNGYDFNPHRPLREGFSYLPSDPEAPGMSFIGCDDKRDGVEYFTISKNALVPIPFP